ncbi:MAG: GNAT family N-acetyltransferase, partial [Cyanobacteria bacterium J06642_3]
QKIRRFLRKVKNSAEFRITNVNQENLERHIEIITEFWRQSWSGRKGVKKCDSILRSMAYELRHCFEHNCLHLPVLCYQDKPVGAVANLLDVDQKTVLFLAGGREETFTKLPSGLVLHAYEIRDAIANGFKIYDFLMGNEAYKYSFGSTERYIHTITVKRQNPQQPRKLDIRTLPTVLKISQEYHRRNYLAKAETGYRQILEVQPQHLIAIYGLSAIAQRQGNDQEAENLLKQLLQIQPRNIKAWFSLGTLHQTHHRLSQAQQAYQQALSYQPEPAIAVAIYHNLGYALQQQDKLDQAIACYQKARELQPNSIEAEVMWANALHLQGKLDLEQKIHYAALNNNLGHKRKQASDFTVAIEYYQQATALNPNLVEAHYHLGTLLQKQADGWDQAISCYQKVLELQPDFKLADLAIANLLHAQGKLSPEQQLEYAQLNNNVGSKYLQAGDFKTAMEFYRQAIALNPKLPEAYYGLGLSFFKQGNREKSISCYQQALAIQPEFELAKVALANLLHAQDKLSPEQKAEYARSSYSLGEQYLAAGDFKAAVEYYELAVRLNPEFTEARQSLKLAMEHKSEGTIKLSCAK